MSQLPDDEQFELLAAGYFDEVLDNAGRAALKALLHEDDRRVKRFAELAQLNQMIASEIAYGEQAEKFGLNLGPNDNAAAGALAELASLYEDDFQDPLNFAVWREEQAHKAHADCVVQWRNRLMIGGAVAALLAVVGLLAIVLSIGQEPPIPVAEQVADDPLAGLADPIERTEPTERVVARLTATHDAAWAEGASAAGSSLRVGQRLTLTAGFAEITTNDGAIAILEAPATVELLDNNNALHLHTGKLVGICETETSKGFLVRTPHLDVTDLSTRFGVDADAEASIVQVFEGMVYARHTHAPADEEPMLVTAKQSVRAVAEDATVQRAEPDPDRFAAIQPAPIQLPGTGQGLATGQPASNWLVMTADETPLDPPAAMFAADASLAETLFLVTVDGPEDPRPLEYTPATLPSAQRPTVTHLVQTGFTIDDAVDAASTRLVIAFAGDDAITAIHVNGNRVEVLGNQLNRVQRLTIDKHLQPGHNTVAFEVVNKFEGNRLANVIRLYVDWCLLPSPADFKRSD